MEITPIDPAGIPPESQVPPAPQDTRQSEEQPPEEEVIQDDEIGENVDLLT